MSNPSDRWASLFSDLTLLQQVVRAGLAHAETGILLQRASNLEGEFESGFTNRAYRSAVAATLIAIHDILSARLLTAPIDQDGLPVLPGIRWNPRSPLAGALQDIPPFSALDSWVAALEPAMAARRHHPPRPSGNLRLPELIIQGRVPSNVTRVPRPQLPRDALRAPSGLLSDDISTWLDVIGTASDLAGFAAELLGAAAVEFGIGVFGVALAIVGVPVTMWATQQEAEKLASYNGYLRGFSESLEALWMPYLGRNPADLEPWPPIVQFAGQIRSDGSSTSDAAALGYRAGVRKSNEYVRKLEREKRHKGQLFLLAAARTYNDARGVRVFILRHQHYRNAEYGYRLDLD